MPVSHLQRSVAAAAQKIRQSWSREELALRQRQAQVMQLLLLERLGWTPALAPVQRAMEKAAG